MRKTLQTIIAILAFAAVVTACTKTEDTANEAVRQGEATIERIMDFKQQMEGCNRRSQVRFFAFDHLSSYNSVLWSKDCYRA